MPLPIPGPAAPPTPDPTPVQPHEPVLQPASRSLPYWQRQPELWAEAQVRDSHVEALGLMGEWAMFVLLWHADDLAGGLVERCSRCYASPAESRFAAVYNQPFDSHCPVCFGTTFEGGYRAKVVRPSLWSDSGPDTVQQPRGEVRTDSMSVETTGDFTLRHGDWVVRSDGSRYRALEGTGGWLRTGMARPALDRSVGGAVAQVRLEDRPSPAYLVPPLDLATIREALELPSRQHLMPDPVGGGGYSDVFHDLYAYYERTGFQDVRGPLLVGVLPGTAAP